MPTRRPLLDPIAVLEAAYSLDGSSEAWLKNVLGASSPGIDRGRGAVAFTTDLPRMLRGEFEAVVSTDGDPMPMLVAVNSAASPEIVDLLTRRAWVFGSMSELLAPLRGHERADYDRAAEGFDLNDAVGLHAQDGEGGIINVTAPSSKPASTTETERALWARLAAHITAMVRLRRRLQPVEAAIVTPEGRVAHAVDDARPTSARDVIVRAVRDRERARGRLRAKSPENALAIWHGLVDGRWSLVDRFESDDSRWVVAYRNDPQVADPRRLTSFERQVVHYAARGAANKEIAYALGRSISTVAIALGRAYRKLRIRRRAELASLGALQVAASLRVGDVDVEVLEEKPPKARTRLDALTTTEREVAVLSAKGASDAEIAKKRGTSTRTVSNQLARIYKKLRIHSRTELAHLLRTAR